MRAEGLSFTYPGRSVPTLDDLTFTLPEGKVVGLFGPNGSGKTTLLKCLTGFNRIGPGKVFLEGDVDIASLNVRERSRQIAFVPQELSLNMPFTVREVVTMGLETYVRSMYPSEEDMRMTEEVIGSFGLQDIADEHFTELSGGQRQLVSVARAVNQRAKYLFLDEPVSNLDFSNAHGIWKKLRELNSEGLSVLISSHDPNHILRYCDTVLMMAHGRILGIGSPDEMLTEENLYSMFGMDVICTNVGGRKMVLPAENGYE